MNCGLKKTSQCRLHLKDPGRPNVGEYLRDVGARVSPVGRLDFHTSGALLCTNDGEFASKLAHPRYHVEKDYVAKVRGVLDQASLARFGESIEIDGRKTRPADVTLLRVEGDKSWIGVKLEEGKNRQVRRLGEHAGFLVMRLVRVSQAGVSAEGLRPGEWRRPARWMDSRAAGSARRASAGVQPSPDDA